MTDALVSVLNGLGYMPVFIARAGLLPPDLYDLDDGNKLVQLGPLSACLPTGTKLPPPDRNDLPDIHYKETSGKTLKMATSFLENALKCIGISAPVKLDLSFAGSGEFTFSFSDVSYAAIPPLKLYPLLKDIDTTGIPQTHVKSGRLHLAYEYAYAGKLLLRRADKKSFEHDITGLKIGTFIDIGTSGQVNAKDETTLVFKGKRRDPVAFAYKAGRLDLRGSHWEMFVGDSRKQRGFLAEASVSEKSYLPARSVVINALDA